jgi:sugar lactone lactonase YvrE
VTRGAPFEAVAGDPALLGESPAYDSAADRLVWTDMFGQRVRELKRVDGAGWEPGRSWDLGELAAAVVPRSSGGLVVLTRTEVLGLSDAGERSQLGSVADEQDGIRFNDAKCDPQGRLVAGWMAEKLDRPGAIVRVDAAGEVETILTGVQLANGMDWSPDGTTFYLVDSAALTIDAFDYDATAATLREPRTLVTIERGSGAPNGVAVDDEGCLWVAITYGGEIRRYSSEGELLEVLETPARRVTSCAFAGPDGRELFATSGSYRAPAHVPDRVGLAPELVDAANQDQYAGALFVCRPGTAGPAAVPFAG